MKPHRLHRWIAWLLPLFVLRAFVPAGYMLAPSVDGVQMVFCTGAAPAAMPAIPQAASGHEHHAAHGSHGDDAARSGHTDPAPSTAEESEHDHSASQSSLCVFAVGSTANSPSPQMAVLLDVPVAGSPIDFVSNPALSSVPILIDRIRGPPSA